MEKWRQIKGYDRYKVSNHGRVMNIEGKIITPSISEKGYFRVRLYKDNKTKDPYVHRLVANAFIPNPLGKPQINHVDCDKKNNHINNLQWCTNKENAHHAMANGIFRADRYGEDHPRTKLTNKEALEIRNAILNTSFSRKILAEKYGVTVSIVQEIRYGRSFRNV